MLDQRVSTGKALQVNQSTDTTKPKENIFQDEFEEERKKDSAAARPTEQPVIPEEKPGVLAKSKLFNYRLKFNADYVLAGISNNILVNRYQPFGGYNQPGPIQLNNGTDFNWSFRVGVSDLFEDIKFIGGFRFGSSLSDKDFFLSFQNLRKKIDWGLTFYRSNIKNYYGFFGDPNDPNNVDPKAYYSNMLYTNLYQVNLKLPINEVKSVRFTAGLRTDKGVVRPYYLDQIPDPDGLKYSDSTASTLLTHIEYVHDNTINPAQNIWNGLRFKIYFDFNYSLKQGDARARNIYNIGFDARHYLKIYRNFIWAVRAAGDASFGDARIIYYLGGVDGWLGPKFIRQNRPEQTSTPYAFQSLAINMRGYQQNIANGNNALVINSELRLPVFATLLNRPINSAIVRNFQLVQFLDLGSAWEGAITNISRPTQVYRYEQDGVIDGNNPVAVKYKAGGIGPLAGGYGFGARTTLLGYFLKVDASWQMNGFFRGKPQWYFALGLDF